MTDFEEYMADRRLSEAGTERFREFGIMWNLYEVISEPGTFEAINAEKMQFILARFKDGENFQRFVTNIAFNAAIDDEKRHGKELPRGLNAFG